jgi:hypothetical protein
MYWCVMLTACIAETLNLLYLWGLSNDICLGIVLAQEVEAVKNGSQGCWGMHPVDAPNCCWSCSTTAARMPSSDPNPWPLDHQPLTQCGCWALRDLRMLSSRESIPVCFEGVSLCSISTPVSVWPAVSRKLWAPCTGRRWTIPIQPTPATVWLPVSSPLRMCWRSADSGQMKVSKWIRGMDACLCQCP